MSILGMLGNRPAPSSGGGPTPPASTVIWSVDFSTVADHDFKTTSTLSIEGVTFTAENQASQDVFGIVSGEMVIEGGATGGYFNGTYTAPQLACDWADLMTYAASGAYDPEKTYVWRMIMASGNPNPSGSGYEGPLCGIRRSRATDGMDLHLETFQSDYRAIRGGSRYRDNGRGNTGVSSPRTFGVKYGQAGASWLVSASDLSGQPPFAGEAIYAGYMRNDPGYSVSPGIGVTPFPDSLDLSNASCEAYIGCLSKSGGSAFLWSKLELHEVG